MFVGWYDPDKQKSVRIKIDEAMERYADKFGKTAVTCLANPADVAQLGDDAPADLIVKGASFIRRFTFYVGEEDPPTDDPLW